MEALLILEKGTLNLKSEFGANHLCRLRVTKLHWEVEKERRDADKMKNKTDEDLKQFIFVMSQVNSSNKNTKNLKAC